IFPGACDAGYNGLSAELAFSSDFARDACDFGGERTKLVHHGIDGFFELEDFAADIHRDLLRQVTVGYGDGDFCDVTNLRRQVAGHLVPRFGAVLPDAGHAFDFGLTAEFAFGTDFAGDASHFGCEYRQLIDHLVDELRGFQKLAFEWPSFDLQRHRLAEVAF